MCARAPKSSKRAPKEHQIPTARCSIGYVCKSSVRLYRAPKISKKISRFCTAHCSVGYVCESYVRLHRAPKKVPKELQNPHFSLLIRLCVPELLRLLRVPKKLQKSSRFRTFRCSLAYVREGPKRGSTFSVLIRFCVREL